MNLTKSLQCVSVCVEVLNTKTFHHFFSYLLLVKGIRMLDGNTTDTIEGSALSFKKEYIDIYSCAWGPKDDGKRFGRPGTLASKALELGVKEVRGLLNVLIFSFLLLSITFGKPLFSCSLGLFAAWKLVGNHLILTLNRYFIFTKIRNFFVRSSRRYNFFECYALWEN